MMKDHLNRAIQYNFPPKRIISLVPSITELLYDLDLEKEVVGITKFCVHPSKWYKTKPRVGGTKTIHIEEIKALQPDLIIANKEENQQDKIEILTTLFPVWISDIKTMEQGVKMIAEIGQLTNRIEQAKQLITTYQKQEKEWDTLSKRIRPLQAIYLIWQKPYMTIGGDTYINDCLQKGGFKNLYANETRYPKTSIEAIKGLNPDVILLSSEPFPFKQKHIDALQKELPNVNIQLVDGELFSWYGSRMIQVFDHFKVLHAM